MAKIGIFWVYKDTVIGNARDNSDGEENVPGLLDSPDSHIDLWENTPGFVIPFTELRGTEYQEVPRGRVMYSSKDNMSLVYMDKVLFSEGTKRLIASFFQLNGLKTRWMKDAHYTTESIAIDEYFDDR